MRYRFCFKCKEEAHQPATCEEIKQWQEKCKDGSETDNWIAANTQSCPKCDLPTEKNGGAPPLLLLLDENSMAVDTVFVFAEYLAIGYTVVLV